VEVTLPQFLTLQEVAQSARCSDETVRRACVQYQRSGKKEGLRSIQSQGGRWRIEAVDVLRWLSGEEPRP